MGINTEWRNLVLNSKNECKHAFVETPDFKMKFGVQIFDILTELFSAYNFHTKNNMFTTAQLADFVIRLVTRCIKSGECHTVVVCMDDASRVPKQKKHEQKQRDNARDVDPLPNTSKFYDGGVRVVPSAGTVPFHVKAAVSNRSLRPALFDYIVKRFIRTVSLKKGKHIILDHSPEGAWIHRDGVWGQDPTSRHPFGEADMSMVYWVNRLWRDEDNPANFYIRSTDSDMIPILLHFLQKRINSPTPVRGLWIRYWKVKGSNNVRWVNMRAVFEHLAETFGVKPFIFAACLTGTDYTDPQLYDPDIHTKPTRCLLSRITPIKVWQALHDPEVVKRLKMCDMHFPSFVFVVRAIYTSVVTNTKGRCPFGIPVEARRVLKKKWDLKPRPFKLAEIRGIHDPGTMKFPTNEEMKLVHTQFQWNVGYWFHDWESEPEIGLAKKEVLEDTHTAGILGLPLIPKKLPPEPAPRKKRRSIQVSDEEEEEEHPAKRKCSGTQRGSPFGNGTSTPKPMETV